MIILGSLSASCCSQFNSLAETDQMEDQIVDCCMLENLPIYSAIESPETNMRLDSRFIYNITVALSNIIFNVYNESNGDIAKGRAFGTKGEHRAAEIIYENMTLLGLNTTFEQLDKRPGYPNDDIISRLEILDYGVKVNGESIDCYIAPSWKGPRDHPLQLDYTFSFNGLKIKHMPKFPCIYNRSLAKETEDFVFIDNDQWNDPNGVLPVVDLLKPFSDPLKFYMLFHITSLFNIKMQTAAWYQWYPCCKGLILYDFNNDCHDMIYFAKPYDNSLPVLFINGRIGKKIVGDIKNHTIDFDLKQRYNTSTVSYNVIGQLNGTDPTKTVIVSSLYDSWWCQGTADSAIGMSIVLAIAKYFHEHQIIPKYTIKFIAFGGEEYGMKGAAHYEAVHRLENIIYIIDLNQLGFTQEEPRLTLDIVANKLPFLNEIWEVAERSNYVERTGNVADIKKILWASGNIPSNPFPFTINRQSCNAVSFFKDGGWILHHRDGLNHTEGDVLKYFNWTDVNVTGELILNVTKYLTVESQDYSTDCLFPPMNLNRMTMESFLHKFVDK